jgi:RNA polymerase sigma-70 factor (ECF subfamily)
VADETSRNLMLRVQAGDQQAAGELFRRYADRLTALARSRLSVQLAARVDPEDVVQSVYRSFFSGARQGDYQLERGGDLWRLLVAITLHKVQNQVIHHTAAKRSVRVERSCSSDDTLLGNSAPFLARDPSPLAAVALVDEVEQLMRQLEPHQRCILELRLQGYNLYEIAAQTERSLSTVCRVLDRVKQLLEQRSDADGGA